MCIRIAKISIDQSPYSKTTEHYSNLSKFVMNGVLVITSNKLSCERLCHRQSYEVNLKLVVNDQVKI